MKGCIIYIGVGLSALLVSDRQGNAKALIAWNERQTGSTFFMYIYHGLINTKMGPFGQKKDMQSKAKIIIPIVVLFIVILAIVTCTGNKSIFVQWEPVAIPKISSKIKLKVYVENSGSMDGYMQQKSEFKDAVKSYVSALDLLVDTTELYYINTIVSPFKSSISNLENSLNPQCFAQCGGNRTNSDIADMISKVVARTTPNSVSLFISDCILDVPQGDAVNYFGVKQTNVTRTFVKALKKNPNLGVEVIRLLSSYHGMYYYSKGGEPIEGKRPYYIWVVGDKKLIGQLNKMVALSTIQHGYDEYVAYSTTTIVPFSVATPLNKHKIKGKLNSNGQFDFDFMVDMSETLQEESVLMSINNYVSKSSKDVSVSRVVKVSQGGDYTHVLTVAVSPNTNPCRESILFTPPVVPSWIEKKNDDSGRDIHKNMDKTTGIKYLIMGLSDAYKDVQNLATIDFRIKNN